METPEVNIKNVIPDSSSAGMAAALAAMAGNRNDNNDGFGGGGLAALLALGFIGRRDDVRGPVMGEQCVTPALLAASLAGVTENVNNGVVLSKLGSIEGAIPLAEAQVQLALAGAQNAIQGQAVTNSTAQALAAQNQLVATLNSKADILTAINADGDRTRALITATEIATLNRELTVAQSALLEERGTRRSRETEINIVNTNTAIAAQQQQQAQQRQQTSLIAILGARLENLANDIQVVRQSQVTFNSGTMVGSGSQSAANTRVGA